MFFIVWGTRRRKKTLGFADVHKCSNCNNAKAFLVINVKEWFTLFWIPIFPVSSQYFLMCPICGYGAQITKEQALAAAGQPHPPQAAQTEPAAPFNEYNQDEQDTNN